MRCKLHALTSPPFHPFENRYRSDLFTFTGHTYLAGIEVLQHRPAELPTVAVYLVYATLPLKYPVPVVRMLRQRNHLKNRKKCLNLLIRFFGVGNRWFAYLFGGQFGVYVLRSLVCVFVSRAVPFGFCCCENSLCFARFYFLNSNKEVNVIYVEPF